MDGLSREGRPSPRPSHARAVIIGGGIMGCSVAYHLGRLGWSDAILLERHKLTSGSTFHAAGLVGQLRANANVTRLLTESVDLYGRLEAETGQATGWKMSGCLRLACTRDRLTELERQATTARSFGLEMHMLGPSEAAKLWPIMDARDVIGAAFMPSDGQANPSDITQALAKGARRAGVRVVEDCAVRRVKVRDDRVLGVATTQGDIACEVVVNCAGQWAREVGRMAGVAVPVVPIRHQYLVTEPIPGMPRDLPTVRDPDRLTYYKEEVGGLVMGGYEPNPIPWGEDGIPEGFHFTLLDPDWDHFQPMMEAAIRRVPALETAGARDLIAGPEAFTPDGNFILGEAPEARGFYVGAGFNAFGVASAGGAGKALAEWIAEGAPPYDLWPVDIRRFGSHHGDATWTRNRTLELYGKHYAISWPAEEHRAGRPRLRSPLYGRLKGAGAAFGEKLGWERANWFAPEGAAAEDAPSFGRANWFSAVAEEHRACREAVALFDMTSFAKFAVMGEDAEKVLGRLCANDVARPPGRVVYTPMLNARGGIEGDVTVARVADEIFYVVAGTAYRTHHRDWIARHLPEDEEADIAVEDVTERMAVLAVAGPKARAVLAAVNDADMGDQAFPYMTWQNLPLAGVKVRALRVSYVGELGWELHMKREHAERVFDALMAAGRGHGIRLAGYRAIDSLRLERGYRALGADIGPDHTPLEAGLGWAVKLDGGVPFLGRDALIEQRKKPLAKRLAFFTVDDPGVTLWGRETVYRDGERVGWLSSAGFGHTVGKGVGMGYVRRAEGVARDWLLSGKYELEVGTRRVPSALSLAPPYDPTGARVKG